MGRTEFLIFIWITLPLLDLKVCAPYQKIDANVETEGQVLATGLGLGGRFHAWLSKVHHSSPFQWEIFTFFSEKVKVTGGNLRKTVLYS